MNMFLKRLGLTAAVVAFSTRAVQARQAAPEKPHGEMMTNTDGMTLCTFDKGIDGAWICHDACAVK